MRQQAGIKRAGIGVVSPGPLVDGRHDNAARQDQTG